jgi:DNA-binding NtrC family response regulator
VKSYPTDGRPYSVQRRSAKPAPIQVGERHVLKGVNTSPGESLVSTTDPISPARSSSMAHILIVDDDDNICQQLERLYALTNYRVTVVTLAEKALELLEDEDVDLVVTDIRLPGMSGVELTERILVRWGDIPVIVITGFADIDEAVNVLKLGVSDYIVKPFGVSAIQESTQVALQKASLFAEIRHLRRTLRETFQFGGIISKTPEMHAVFETIRMVAPTDSTVIIEGETGTGKELVASAIHHHSERRNGPLVTINCGAVPESLLESELFGNERGAFTGADQARPGKIELADGGTLFLDEIENMPLSMQVKLLLVLETQTVQRLGSNRWTRVDMRVIAASNVPLRELVAQGKLRKDFYYRINVIPIRLLPLRQRLEDIPLLVQDFLCHHLVALRKRITGISPAAIEHLMQYPWPGNVRELQNVLEKAVILTKSRILNVADLQLEGVSLSAHAPVSRKQFSLDISLNEWTREQEKLYLIHKLKLFGGRIDQTAKSCGVDARTIHRKMQIYGLDKKVFSKSATMRHFRV